MHNCICSSWVLNYAIQLRRTNCFLKLYCYLSSRENLGDLLTESLPGYVLNIF